MRSILAAFLLSFALALPGCGTDEAPEPASADPVPVETATARATDAPQWFRYSGTLQGARQVPLATKMMGTVTMLDVEAGDRVQAGQVLVRVRSRNVQAQKRQVEARLRDARAALENAQTTFERMQALREKDSATQKEFDDAKTGYRRAQAQVEALENRLAEVNDMLAYATVRAPMDGYVVEKRTAEGALATPGRPLLVVETLGALKAVVQVPEQDVNRFQVGDRVRVEVGAAGDATRTGVVTQVNPAGNPASRQFQVQVRVTRGPDGVLKSGMYAQVLLQKGRTQALTVPQTALVSRGQLTGLYAVRDGRALLRWVRTGTTYNDRVEVLSGLGEGETYITNATSRRLADGQPVQP